MRPVRCMQSGAETHAGAHACTHSHTQTRGPQWVETASNRCIQFIDKNLLPMSSGASEWAASKQNEWAQRSARAKRAVRRKRIRRFHSHSTVFQDTLKIGQKYSIVARARERVSERSSERTQRRASVLSSADHARKWAVRANEWVDEREAYYYVQWISIVTSSKGQRNLFFRSSISLEPNGKYKELTMKGLEDLFFTSGNSLEAISLERESTVPILRGSESQCILPIVRPKRVSGAAMTTDSETHAHTPTHTHTHTLTHTRARLKLMR